MAEATAQVAEFIRAIDEPNALLTRYVLVAESVTLDGQRNVWIDTSEDLLTWERNGLLYHAIGDNDMDD